MAAHRQPKAFGWQSTRTRIYWSLISKVPTVRKEASSDWPSNKRRHSLRLRLLMYCWLICGRRISAAMVHLTMDYWKWSLRLTWSYSTKSQTRNFFSSWETSMIAAIISKRFKEFLRVTSIGFGLKFTNQRNSLTQSLRTFSNSSIVWCHTNDTKRKGSTKKQVSLRADLLSAPLTHYSCKIQNKKMCRLMVFTSTSKSRGKASRIKKS